MPALLLMMAMSSSTPTLEFLLDENVRIELFRYLKTKEFNVKSMPKSTLDSKLAILSKREKLIIVTNDDDFADYSRGEVFGVVWLRIPQSDPETLISSFVKLLSECTSFNDKLIVLEPNKWRDFPLTEKVP